jgi:hypothetical protein
MKFTKILFTAYTLFASVGAMAFTQPGALGTPVDDLALLGLAVAALVAGAGVIRRRK